MSRSACLPAMLLLIVSIEGRAADAPEPELLKGKLVKRVNCQGHAGQNYALYLPLNYTAEKKWPILYAFDAGAHGIVPVQRFQKSAEQLGVIVCGSNNSRNGPWEPIQKAIEAMWEDTHKRFAIDEKQVYTTGFSGGGRVATQVAIEKAGKVAGVIGQSGGFPPGKRPDKEMPFLYFGTAGTADFNLREMRYLDRLLDDLNLPHGLEIFKGGHTWAPAKTCGNALTWMALQAMRKGAREKDNDLIASILKRRTTDASNMEKEGEPYDAFVLLKQTLADFDGLADIAEVKASVERLAETDAIKEAIKKKEEEAKERKSIQDQVQARMATLREDLKDAGKRAEVIAALKRDAQEKADAIEGRAAKQIIQRLYMSTYRGGSMLLRQKQYARAARNLEIASLINPENAVVHYNLACARALEGKPDKAIAALKASVEKGYDNLKHMQNDPDLNTLRENEAYKAIVKQLEKGE